MAPLCWILGLVGVPAYAISRGVRHRCPPVNLRVSPDNGPYNNRFDTNARAPNMLPDRECDDFGDRPEDSTNVGPRQETEAAQHLVGIVPIADQSDENNTVVGLPGQPATWGQDEQECGMLLLPNRFYVAPKGEAGFLMDRVGTWKTKEGATLAEWTEGLYAWQPESVYVFLGSKLIFKAEPMWQGNDLPEQWPSELLQSFFDTWTEFDTIILRDCRHALLYVVRVLHAEPSTYQIYDRAGKLVARAQKGLDVDGRLVFYDEHDIALAVAQAPLVSDNTAHLLVSNDDGEWVPNEIPKSTNIASWEIWFYDRTGGSTSSLLLAENRYVLAAVTQHRAMKVADLTAQVTAGNIGPLQNIAIIATPILLRGLFAAVPMAILFGAFASIHQVVFPVPPQKLDHRFLEEDAAAALRP